MLKVKKSAAAGAAPVTFELGHGATLTARVVDAFDHKMTLATARAELSALIAGDKTQHAWTSFTRDRVELIRSSEAAQASAIAWMHTVLLATVAGVSLQGVSEFTDAEIAEGEAYDAQITEMIGERNQAEGGGTTALDTEIARLRACKAALGKPLEPSFEAFELLFNDAGVESVFRLQAFKVEALWSAEKNVSGPRLNTSGPVDATIAAAAKTLATPAPAADAATTEADALLSSTPLEPAKANLPSNSPPAADAGTS